MLGLGAMGSALATALLDSGRSVTVWNRTPGRAEGPVARGARAAGPVREAVTASPVVVACLFTLSSVQETLGPVAAVQALISRQIAAGHGAQGLPRIYESLRAVGSGSGSDEGGAA